MGFWKTFFGDSGGARVPSRSRTELDRLVNRYRRLIDPLAKKADKLILFEQRPEDGLTLCLRAIDALEGAPTDDQFVNELGTATEVGMAFHLATIALLELRRPESEFDALCGKAKARVPLDVPRLREMYTTSKVAQDKIDRATSEATRFLALIGPLQRPSEIAPDARRRIVQETLEDSQRDEHCWDLREAAKALALNGDYDLAWSIFNCALTAKDARHAGADPSIYAEMGALCKRQRRYRDASRMYLLACSTGTGEPTKAMVEQFRICLKKAGLGDRAANVRDNLLSMAKTMPCRQLVTSLDAHFAESEAEASQGLARDSSGGRHAQG